MRQEDTDTQFFWREAVYFVSTTIPGILGRIFESPSSSFVTSNENLEYSLGKFLMGTSLLLMLLMFRRWATPDLKKGLRWYFTLYALTIPVTIFLLWVWIQSFTRLLTLF